jgi:hypothetical protein
MIAVRKFKDPFVTSTAGEGAGASGGGVDTEPGSDFFDCSLGLVHADKSTVERKIKTITAHNE